MVYIPSPSQATEAAMSAPARPATLRTLANPTVLGGLNEAMLGESWEWYKKFKSGVIEMPSEKAFPVSDKDLIELHFRYQALDAASGEMLGHVVVFKFHLNPIREARSYAKMHQIVFTNGGHFIQSWGNDMVTFAYSGKTRPFLFESYSGMLEGGKYRSIRETSAWKKFEQFEHFYLLFNSGNEIDRPQYSVIPTEVSMVVGYAKGEIWKGIITDLTYDVDGDNPFFINYNFTFKAFPSVSKSAKL